MKFTKYAKIHILLLFPNESWHEPMWIAIKLQMVKVKLQILVHHYKHEHKQIHIDLMQLKKILSFLMCLQGKLQ